jgi:predicted DNA-binding transcriptional regulator YafY
MMKATKRATSRDPWFRYSQISEFVQARNEKGKYPSCPDIAEKLSVCEKTIQRDVASMQGHGMAIVHDRSLKGYRFTEPPRPIIGFDLTPNEFRALITGQKALAESKSPSFATVLMKTVGKLIKSSDAYRKVAEAIDKLISFRLVAPEKFDATGELVLDAADQRRGLRFRYRHAGEIVEHAFNGHPYQLCCVDNMWRIFMFIPAENRLTSFIIHRMSDVVMTDETFERPADFDHTKYLRGGFVLEPGKEEFEVIVELDFFAADVLDFLDLEGGTFVKLPGGRARYHIWLNTLDDIAGRILQFGMHATVIQPPALLERMQQHVRVMHANYFPKGDSQPRIDTNKHE